MYQKGDRLVYGIHGVCEVYDITVQLLNRKRVEYYVLVPLSQPDARFFVPTGNEAAVAKMRPLLTKEQIEALMSTETEDGLVWISEENQRKQSYKELISSGDRAGLIGMVRLLYRHKEHQLAHGRKFHLCDDNFLRDAEKLLCSEFSFVLGIPPEIVGKYIQDRLR